MTVCIRENILEISLTLIHNVMGLIVGHCDAYLVSRDMSLGLLMLLYKSIYNYLYDILPCTTL